MQALGMAVVIPMRAPRRSEQAAANRLRGAVSDDLISDDLIRSSRRTGRTRDGLISDGLGGSDCT
jgi:hypothetical protein